MNQKTEYEDVTIPTYVINLEERTDRLIHIKKQFVGKDEFDLNIIEATRHTVGAIGLWHSIVGVINQAISREEDVIIICEDDHEFTEYYSKECLIKNIIEANKQGVCILSGGISSFNQVVPVASNRWWIDSFCSTQFIVIYKGVFEAILAEPFVLNDVVGEKLSEITSQKMVIHPFISIKKEFGYSDVRESSDQIKRMGENSFKNSSKRIEDMAVAYHKYRKAELDMEGVDEAK